MLCWEICKRGEGLDGTEPAVRMAVARARVHANGNDVIVLINLAYYAGEDSEFQREFLFELKALILPLTILDNDL